MSNRILAAIWSGMFLSLTLTGSARAADPAAEILAPKDAVGYFSIDSLALQKRPDLQPFVLALREIESYFPIDLLSTHRITVAICPRTDADRPHEPVLPFMTMQFRDAAAARVLVESCEGLVPMEHAGKKFLSSPTPRYPSIYHLDERTLILSYDRLIKNFIDDPTPSAEIRAALARPNMQGEVQAVFLPATHAAAIESAEAPKLTPPAIVGLKKVPKHVSLMAGRVNLAGDEVIRVELETKGDEATKEVNDRLESALSFLRDLVNDVALPQVEQLPIPAEIKKAAKPFSDETLGKVKIAADAKRVLVTLPASAEAALLAKQWIPVAAKEMEKSIERSMQLMQRYMLSSLATNLRAYVTKNMHFPDDLCDRTGKPMMSWRCELVADQQDYLFRDQELDASLPWNAEPNRTLLAKVSYPFVSNDGRKVQGIGLTSVYRFTGPGTLFQTGRPVGDENVKDGLAKTILCVQASPKIAAPWAKPVDIVFDAKDPLAGLGPLRGDTFMAVFCDGTVRKIPKTIKAADLKALITPAGGEEVDLSKYDVVDRGF